jgi:hypothetical protein
MTSEVRKQLDLLPSADPHVEPMTPELIRSIRKRSTFLNAWNFALDFAALEDKQVYQPLGVDSAHWSKIRSGRASPPADERFLRFFDIVQNEIPLVWLAEARGYDWSTIRKHQSSQERRIAELEGELRDVKRTFALVLEAQKGK